MTMLLTLGLLLIFPPHIHCKDEEVRVMIPMNNDNGNAPFWMRNNQTGQLSGFFVDLLHELFRSMQLNFTLENKINYEPTYDNLGKYLQLWLWDWSKILIILVSVHGLAAGDFDIIIGDLTIVPLLNFRFHFKPQTWSSSRSRRLHWTPTYLLWLCPWPRRCGS